MIDSHQHFWRLARGDYAWLTPDLGVLYRDFEPAELAALQVRHGVTHSIAVQAAPTVAETSFLLSLAEANPFIAGVVGWVDFETPAALEQLAEWAPNPRFVGVRPMIQDIADPDWMLGEALRPCFDAICDAELCFDALVHPQHLGRLLTLCQRHPELRVVIDHAAKPAIAEREFDTWAEGIAALARETNAHCKLSGLVTEAEPDWKLDSLRPYVEHLLACFGTDRLLWGSDWPVVELAGGYARWRTASEELLAGLATDERAAIFGGNARRCYRLTDPPTCGASKNG